MDYVTIAGLSKKAKSRTPDMPIDEDDPIYLEHPEKLEEDRKGASIPLIELLKHFPYHNSDYTVWLDREFGAKTEGFTIIPGLDEGKAREYLEPLLEQIPDLTQQVELKGRGFTRQIGITTAGKAQKLKADVCKHPALEDTLEREKVRTVKVKGKDVSVGHYEADKVRAFAKGVKDAEGVK